MGENEGWKSKELLIIKEKVEDDDLEWLEPDNRGHPKKQQRPVVWFIVSLPWILLALLGSWNLAQYQKRDGSATFDPTQQVYSLLALILLLLYTFG
jgi:hypothetical protein